LGLDTGLPRLDSPPLPSSAFSRPLSPTPFSKTEQTILSPLPVRLRPLAALQPPDTLETWTRSPTKSEVDPVVGSWHLTTGEGESIPEIISSSKDLIKLLPMPETFDVDRGLLLAVQAIQTLLNAKGQPVIVGIGRSLLTTVHLGTTVNVKNWSIFCRDFGEA
jgi:hypothetical protein